MSSTQLAPVLAVVSTVAAVIQTVVIVVSLLYVRNSIVQASRQNQLNTLISASSLYRKVNELELADADLAALMGERKEDAFASIILIDFETRKAMHDRAALEDPFWEADVLTFIDTFRQPFMREHWKQAADVYTSTFREFVNTVVIPQIDKATVPAPK